MIVEVCLGEGSGKELVLLELQGIVESRGKLALNGQHLGDLSFKGTVPILLIGNQEMRGKVVTLSKPFAVLRKTVATYDSDSDAADAGGPLSRPPSTPVRRREDDAEHADSLVTPSAGAGAGEPVPAPADVSYVVAGIIRKKLLFAKRPQPVLTTKGGPGTNKRKR